MFVEEQDPGAGEGCPGLDTGHQQDIPAEAEEGRVEEDRQPLDQAGTGDTPAIKIVQTLEHKLCVKKSEENVLSQYFSQNVAVHQDY